MAPTFKVAAFVESSARYATAAVEKANTNGNAYLTKTESKALPKDLQDNFEAFRSRSFNGVATAKQFANDYASYVKDAARRADTNSDGIFSAQELARLPKDLQDNAANFGRIAPAPAPAAVSDISLPLKAESIETVRAAFVEFVEGELTARRPSEFDEGFEYENHSWAELVREYGGDDQHEALKAELLEAARNWNPESNDWMVDETWSGGVSCTGHFKFVTLMIELQAGKKPQFFTEID